MSEQPSSPRDPHAPLPTIAVVAVHGVGEHEPEASARALRDLLLRLRHEGRPRYTSFKRKALSIPVQPMVVSPTTVPTARDAAEAPATEPATPGRYNERSYFLTLAQDGRVRTDRDTDGADHQFMRAQLAQYESDGAPYETVRLEGQRLEAVAADADEPRPESNVHVYEMYWSDLSRVGTGALRILGDLFQLLFHLPHLGRQAIDHARLEHGAMPEPLDDRARFDHKKIVERRRRVEDHEVWKSYGQAHVGAVRLLTLVIPPLWLALFVSALTSLVPTLVRPAREGIVIVAAAALFAAVAGTVAYRKQDAWGARVAPFLPLAPVAALGGGALAAWRLFYLAPVPDALLTRWVVWSWLAVGAAAIVWLSAQYEQMRPGARRVGIACAILMLGAMAWSIATTRGAHPIVDASFHVIEAGLVLMSVVWIAFGFCALGAGLLGWETVWRAPAEARDRVRRVAWTMMTTLAISTTLLLVLSFAIWSLTLVAFRQLLPTEPYFPVIPLLGLAPASYPDYAASLFRVAAGGGFPIALVASALLAIVAASALFVSIWREVSPPNPGRRFENRATGELPQDAAARAAARTARLDAMLRDDAESERSGEWLTRGYALLGRTSVVLFAVVVAMPLVSLVDFMTGGWLEYHTWSAHFAQALIIASGSWLAATATGFAVFGGRFRRLLLGFRTALDAALDVDNYLREHPRTRTPRAMIAERYASLLRYLCRWRDPEGRPYDAIIVVAHSQGTVISADVVGFAHREKADRIRVADAALEPLVSPDPDQPDRRLYLFTMGSPLRQLYAQCFPHLFGWVTGEARTIRKPLAPRPRAASPGRDAGDSADGHRPARVSFETDTGLSPDPTEIGIARWVNAYRSGDYVGRSLWRIASARFTPWLYRAASAESVTGARDTADEVPFVEVTEDAARTRRELCIGAGAHTHYWDATARAIAAELDLLIVDGYAVRTEGERVSV